jgi:uncharacterized membrane protein HdeD (DUF308 family)
MTDDANALPKKAWGWLAALGVLLIAMGIFAIAAPLVASLAVGAWIGVLFLIAGVGQIAHAVSVKGWRPSLGHLAVGAIYGIGGLLVIFKPLAGLMAFTLLICAMLLAAGVVRLIAAFQLRPAPGWGWLAAAGATALIAGVAVFASFPGSSLWLLGLLAGLSFLSEGWALLTLGLLLRKAR